MTVVLFVSPRVLSKVSFLSRSIQLRNVPYKLVRGIGMQPVFQPASQRQAHLHTRSTRPSASLRSHGTCCLLSVVPELLREGTSLIPVLLEEEKGGQCHLFGSDEHLPCLFLLILGRLSCFLTPKKSPFLCSHSALSLPTL